MADRKAPDQPPQAASHVDFFRRFPQADNAFGEGILCGFPHFVWRSISAKGFGGDRKAPEIKPCILLHLDFQLKM